MIRFVRRSIAATAFVVFSFTIVGSTQICAETNPTKVLAGKTIAQYTKELKNENRVVRLRAARSLTAMGSAAGTTLTEALSHDDPAVRYVAAVGLGRIGGKTLKASTPALEKSAATEEFHAAEMAMAFALCRSGKTSEHLPVLIKALSHKERGVVCGAAELLGEIGPPAIDAIETLKSVHATNKAGVKGGDYHIGGAAMNALRKIDPENFQ